MTTAKLNSQLVMVEMALALVRIAFGLISAGYNQGSSSHVLVYTVSSMKVRERKRGHTIQRTSRM